MINPQDTLGIVTPNTVLIDTPLELESGGKLESYELIYETYGELNADASNAVMVCHALSSDHHAAGYHSEDKKSVGWWNTIIGPNKTIDTNHFFVVCCNNLGGCSGSTGPESNNPSTGKPYGPDFPIVTVGDWVESQAQLADRLGIKTWAAVVGGSLGGMQVIEWSIRFPQRLQAAVVIASSAKLSAQNIGFNDVARQAIRTDPEFHDGNYYAFDAKPERGLRIARMLGHITYLSDDLMAKKFGRNLREKEKLDYEYNLEFEVESYLRYQGDKFINMFDANTYLLMTKALDYFDPAAKFNDSLTQAFNNTTADFLVMSFTSDWRFPSERSREIVRALQNNALNVSYAEIDTAEGHDSFLMEIPDYTNVLKSYMSAVKNKFVTSRKGSDE